MNVGTALVQNSVYKVAGSVSTDMGRVDLDYTNDGLLVPQDLLKGCQNPANLPETRRRVAKQSQVFVTVSSTASNDNGKECRDGIKEKELMENFSSQSPMKSKLKRRILKSKADNPLLRPLSSIHDHLASSEPRKDASKDKVKLGWKKDYVMNKVKRGGFEQEGAVEAVDTKGLDRYCDTSARWTIHNSSPKDPIKIIDIDEKAVRLDGCESSREKNHTLGEDEEMLDGRQQPRAASRECSGDSAEFGTRNMWESEPEFYQSDQDQESDGLSDFIVDDDTLQEDDSDSPMPAPRPRRRLVRGRRPGNDQNTYVDILDSRMRELSLVNARGEKTTDRSSDMPMEKLSYPAEGKIGDEDGLVSEKHPTQQEEVPYITTPPRNPEKKIGSLISPKKTQRIPQPSHRPSMGSFWSQEAVNEWNDEYSPRKMSKPAPTLFSKADISGEDLLPSPAKSKQRENSDGRAMKKEFSIKKQQIAESFLVELDSNITDGRIAELTAESGGVKIIWSKTLQTTAGRANWRREAVQPLKLGPDGAIPKSKYRHHASIELAERIISDEDRLLNVMAHEFCHLATFMISNVKNNPHGKEFKSWGAKCSRRFGDKGVEVTTKHSYSIEYKYIWECTACKVKYKRQSKSIDPARHKCGACKGQLLQIKPAPRGGDGKLGEYQQFVKDNMKKIKAENPGSPQKDIMGIIGRRYQEHKALKLKAGQVQDKAECINQLSGSVVRKLDFLTITDLGE